MFKRKTLSLSISIALSASLIPDPIKAEEVKDRKEIEKIVVTATKRAENIQDVPVAVTALNGDQLESLGVSNFDAYVEYLPNVTFQGTGPGQNEIYIRGAATTQTGIAVSSVQALQPSVAFYLDEQPVSMQGRNLDIYAADIDRIEVLPGPQGTLFGASSQSGTVRMITKKPDHFGLGYGFDASISTTKGGEPSHALESYVNFTPTDDVAVRVVMYNDVQGGWIDNILNEPGKGGFKGSPVVISRVSGGVLADPENTPIISPRNDQLVEDDFNDAMYSGVRVGVSYDITDDWNLLLQHTGQQLQTEGVFAYDPNLEGESSANRFVPEDNDDSFGLTTWTLKGRLSELEVIYTGGYLDREIDSTIDYTGYTNGGLFSAYYACTYGGGQDEVCYDPTGFYKEHTESSRLTHELRFNTDAENQWRLTAGIFYDEQDLETVGLFQLGAEGKFPNGVWGTDGAFLAGTDGINSNGGPFPVEVSFVNDVGHGIDQLAVFGQLEFDVTDTLTVSAGARWYEITDNYKGATTTVDVSGRLKAFGDGSDAALEELEGPALVEAVNQGQLQIDLLDKDGELTVDDTIFHFGLDWKPTDNVLLFATRSEGFRPPVTNRVGGGLATNQAGAFEGFRIPVYSLTDTLENYELGIKSNWLDNSLRLNATAFYSEIDNLQTSRFDPANISFLVFTDNVGDAEISGVDADFQWYVSNNFVLSGAASILDTELTSINRELKGIAPDAGSQLPYSSEFSANLQARYYFGLSDGFEGYVNGAVTYTGDQLAGMKMDAYVLEDATQLIYGTGSGLEIQEESATFNGVNYTDRNGQAFKGGRYVQPSYTLVNMSVGVTRDGWSVEAFVNNLFDKRAVQYIDTQQFTPKVVSNRPRTVGIRYSYDF